MYEFYIDDRASRNDSSPHLECCAAYLFHEEDGARFNRSWRNLLIKHGLPRLNLEEWREVTRRNGWSGAKRQAVVADFIQATERSHVFGLTVAVDAHMWAALKQSRRRPFGSAADFCFQRLLRLMLDHLEAANETQPIAIIFGNDLENFRDRVRTIQASFRLDSRATLQACLSP